MVLRKVKNEKRRVVVTGVGPMCSLGIGREETWNSILSKNINLLKQPYFINNEKWGEFYLHKIRNFNIDKFKIPEQNLKFIKEIRNVKKEDTDLYYFLAVINLALIDSGLKYNFDKNDIGVMITQENPGVEIFFEELIESAYDILKTNKSMTRLQLAKALYGKECESRGYNLQSFSYLFSVAKVFGLHGYSLFINNACASGLFAIESAARQIISGMSPAVIVAAIDDPTKIYKYLWFKRHGLYAEDGITRPFSGDSSGIVFGDGGAALVLEDFEHAKKRGAEIYGEYLGGGFSLEGWKITVPDITDDFYTRSFRKALETSGVGVEDIDFVNPHGVGMRVTDIYEARTIKNIFGQRKPFISAFKPLVGHNLGGSALLETVISLISMKNGVIPGTLNCKGVKENFDIDLVLENKQMKFKTIAKMACGFAGFSGVTIFQKIKGN